MNAISKNPEEKMNADQKIRIAFFGTPDFSVTVLHELKKAGLMPSLIVTNPDKPQGRGLVLTPPAVKEWAIAENIPFIQPKTLRDAKLVDDLKKDRWDLFIVAVYGKIIPKDVLELPLYSTLNVHPSLLPKYRGSSPIHSAILADDKDVGVSIMVLDEAVDHGPVLAQERIPVGKAPLKDWPPSEPMLQKILAERGGALLAQVIPDWIERKIEAVPQIHDQATFTKKITKEDGLLDLAGDPYQNFLKIQAFTEWPGTYFFMQKNDKDGKDGASKQIRVIVKKAEFKDGKLEILRVVPEGRKEMDYKNLQA